MSTRADIDCKILIIIITIIIVTQNAKYSKTLAIYKIYTV